MVVAVLWSLAGTASADERADKLAAKADTAFVAGDRGQAFKWANRALARDPNQVKAHFVRAMTLLSAVGAGVDADGSMRAMADDDLRAVLALSPDSMLGAQARLALGRNAATLPDPVYDCSAEGVAAFNAAEQRFAAGDMDGARAGYEATLAVCPGHATAWIDHGDTWFSVGNAPAAIADYQRALEIDACQWQARRFLGDVLWSTGKREDAFEQDLQAVACNPGYELGWRALQGMGSALGKRVSWAAPDVADPSYGTYAFALASAQGDALERSRTAVGAVLAGPHSASWDRLARAQTDGTLDEAIFCLLLDPSLAALYPTWSAAHPGAVEAFIRSTLIE